MESESGINGLFPWKRHVTLDLDCSFCDDGSQSMSERFCNCIHLIDLDGSVDWRGTWFGFLSGGLVCAGCSWGQIGLLRSWSRPCLTTPCRALGGGLGRSGREMGWDSGGGGGGIRGERANSVHGNAA